MVERQDREKPKANDRSRLKSAVAEIWMMWFNNVVKTNHGLMELGADAANEPIAKRRHPAQKNSRSSFGAPISLCSGVSATSPSLIAGSSPPSCIRVRHCHRR